MIIGFKTGPKNWEESKRIVLEDGARMCEVWFNVGKADDYEEMFNWLKEHNVMVGLHHWGAVDGKFKTNLATQDEHIRGESVAQMKRTIDIGKRISAVYVNVHPGARWREMVDFDKEEQSLIPNSETPVEISEKLLLEAAQELHEYGKKQEMVLTVETLPGREPKNYGKREGIYDAGNPPLSLIAEISKQGSWIANDIAHSASTAAVVENTREGMWQALREFSQQVAPMTRLIHVNTMREPFDGRDSHDGLTTDDFAQGFFPSRAQMIELLQLFAGRGDVYVVPEPQIQFTRENFLALQEIAEEAKVA